MGGVSDTGYTWIGCLANRTWPSCAKVVVFVDGDFWHGWRFPWGREKIGDYCEQKNRREPAP